TPLCCNDIHEVSPRASALAGCDTEAAANAIGVGGFIACRALCPDDKAPKPTSSQLPKPKPSPTKPSKAVPEKKRKPVKETLDEPSPTKRSKGGLVGKRRKPKSPLKLVDEFVNEGIPHKEPAYDDEEANLQRALKLSLKDQGERT
ncbi:retrovirus-related pol polyprotein from transposon TNT 1-94, partial [Tanacetum coccineum]